MISFIQYELAQYFNIQPFRLLAAVEYFPELALLDGGIRYVDVCSKRVYGYNTFDGTYFMETIRGTLKPKMGFSKEHLRVAKHFKKKPYQLFAPDDQFLDGTYRFLDMCTTQVYGYDKLNRRYFKDTLTNENKRLFFT